MHTEMQMQVIVHATICFMQSIPDCQEQNKPTAYLPQAVVGAVAIQEGSLPEVVNIKKLLVE